MLIHDTHICCRAFGNGAVTTSFKVSLDRGSNPDLPHAKRTLYHLATAAVYPFIRYVYSFISSIENTYVLSAKMFVNVEPKKYIKQDAHGPHR